MRFDTYTQNQLNESINDRGIFKAVFMSGTPGSGKSYVLSRISSGNIDARVVNVDRYTEFLNINDIYSVYDKAKKLTVSQLANYINGVLPLFVDMTGCNILRIQNRVRTLEQFGYDVSMVFVNTPLETALMRAKKRIRKVPEGVIKEYYDKLTKVKNDVKQLFSFSIEINNDEGELTDDVILKAFKKISYFYDAEIKNPIGSQRYDEMIKYGYKYLDPNIVKMEEIKRSLDTWFGK